MIAAIKIQEQKVMPGKNISMSFRNREMEDGLSSLPESSTGRQGEEWMTEKSMKT